MLNNSFDPVRSGTGRLGKKSGASNRTLPPLSQKKSELLLLRKLACFCLWMTHSKWYLICHAIMLHCIEVRAYSRVGGYRRQGLSETLLHSCLTKRMLQKEKERGTLWEPFRVLLCIKSLPLCNSSDLGYNRGERWEYISWHGTNSAVAREARHRHCEAMWC